jgi:glycosyltransferase involved in cell wall biosynthesis
VEVARILWVVPRFARDVVGGAELLTHRLAARAVHRGYGVEIATTCALDHETWANELPAGTSVADGLRVHRFPVSPRDPARYEELHAVVLGGAPTYADELEWLAQSVSSTGLQRFIEDEAPSHDLVLFAPYLFGTTVWGAQVSPDRSALLPCLHDEPYAYLSTVARVFRAVRGSIFNSDAEARLAARLYGLSDGSVVGVGVEIPARPPERRFAASRGLGRYLLYAGRLEQAKRVDVLVEYASQYAAERPEAPKLVLVGRGSYRPPAWAEDAVVPAGFVDDEDLRAAYAEALAVVNPSTLESLSLVLLEAWREGTPVLAAAASDVMRDHVELSGGGLLFDSYEEFRDAVDRLDGDPELGGRLGQAGREYVASTYAWETVDRRFDAAVRRLAA